MKKLISRACAAVACAFIWTLANAQLVVDVGPMKAPEIPISRSSVDLTRIAVYEGGLSTIRYAKGALSVTKAPETRSAYIVPNVTGKIPAFIVTSSGQTHMVTFVASDKIGSQSIILREPKLEDAHGPGVGDPAAPRQIVQRVDRATSFDAAIKRLIGAMARGESPADVTYSKVDRDFNLWEGTRFTLQGRYASRAYVGETYRLQNGSAAPMRFDEREFYKKGVLAVAMELHELAPGEATDVFVVRGATDGN